MRVGLDLTDAVSPEPTGLGLYALALARSLAEQLPAHEYTACFRLRAATLRGGLPSIPSFRRLRYWGRFAPLLSRRLDVFHGTASRAVRAPGLPQVVTLHDVVHLAHSDYADGAGRLRRIAHYQEIRLRAHAVIVPSAFCKQEVIARLGVPDLSIWVVPLAPAPAFLPRTSPDPAVLARLGLDRPYVLFVGGISERKNVLRLMQSFARLPEGLQLVLAGSVRSAFRSAFEAAAALLGPRVRQLGYVANAELPSLYAGARALAFPSEYESFGIPLLEAMACGCPVVAADAAALPETAGGAALLCDPASVDSIADGLLRAVSAGSERERAVAAGLARAAEFSYARTARETARVYDAVAGG